MMESSEHSEQAVRDIENSIQNSVDDVIVTNNKSKCENCNIYKYCFYTVLTIFIIAIIIILIIRLK